MKISKSKRQLAQLLIEAGVTQFPDGAKWAAQDKCDFRAEFYDRVPKRDTYDNFWHLKGAMKCYGFTKLPTLAPYWHQTVISREEFDQVVAETMQDARLNAAVEKVKAAIPTLNDVAMKFQGEEVMREHKLTLDQLLADWRNAEDYAQRKQTEADEAAKAADGKWEAVQAKAAELGVTIEAGAVQAGASELEITDWRDLKVGDIVWWSGDQSCSACDGEICGMEEPDYTGDMAIRIRAGGDTYWIDHAIESWRFIRRP